MAIEERRHWHARVGLGPPPGFCLDCFKNSKGPYEENECTACVRKKNKIVLSTSDSETDYYGEMEDWEARPMA